MSSKRIVIIGAGPVGIEAALYGAALGHDVQVYEKFKKSIASSRAVRN